MTRKTLQWIAACAALTTGLPVFGQSFSSTSTGSDGALNLTTPGVVVFDPSAFTPALDPDGDNIYHFTTINIAAGVTVQLSSQVLNGPVYWLAQGDVTINGAISLNGANGYACPSPPNPAVRLPSVPGAGGYAGGIGGLVNEPYQPGAGPGGGTGGGSLDTITSSGKFSGNRFLGPLIGGSGGTGGNKPCGGGGGAGGGALLIASSTSITVNGSTTANGGEWGGPRRPRGEPGKRGAIRLAAPLIQGTGSMSAGPSLTPGVVRLEAFQQNYTGTITLASIYLAAPASVTLPAGGPPSVRVASVAGVSVPANSTGSFTIPDAAINQTTPATISIQAKNIPVGTAVTLYISSENGPDLTVPTSALAGTLASSTASAVVSFPPGFSRGYVRASWAQ
jgi:hypothetical protein